MAQGVRLLNVNRITVQEDMPPTSRMIRAHIQSHQQYAPLICLYSYVSILVSYFKITPLFQG